MKPSDHIAELEQRLAALTDECAGLRARVETQDKQLQQLEQVKQQWTATLDAVKDPVFVHDKDFRIIRANAAYARHAGMRIQDTIGKPYWQVFPKRNEPLPGCHSATVDKAGDTDEDLTLESGRIFHSRSFCQTESGSYHCTHILEDITDKQRLQEELRCEQEQAQQYLEVAGVILLLLGRRGTVHMINRMGCEIIGYAEKDILGKNWFDQFLPEQARKETRAVFDKLISGNTEPVEFYENPILGADGKEHLIAWHNVVIRDRHGQPAFVLASGNDITEFRRSQEAARISEEKFRTLFDTIGDAVFIHDTHGCLLEVNQTASEHLGYRREELLGMNVANIDTAEYAALIPERMEALLQRGQGVFESAHLCRNGAIIPVEVSARIMQYEDNPAIISVARNISERKQAEQALQASEEMYRSLFKNMLNGFAYCKMIFEGGKPVDFIYLSVNAAFEAQTGLKNVVGKKVSEVIPGIQEFDPELIETYGRVAMSGNPERFEIYVAALQEWFWMSVYSPKQKYFVAIFDVITKRKQAEEVLKKTNRALRTLSAVNEAVVRATDERQLLERVCQAIVDEGGYRMAWVGYAEKDESKTIRPMAHAGHEEGYLKDTQISWSNDEWGSGPSGAAIRTGKPNFVQSIRETPDCSPWREQALQRGFASSISLPLKSNGTVFGTLNIYSAVPADFREEEIKLLEEMAGDLAYGIITLRISIEHRQQQQALEENRAALKASLTGTVSAAARLIEARDPYTAGHQNQVAKLSVAIARELGWTKGRIEGLQLGAMIHDIGKIKIPADILSKPGRLTEIEFELIKSHPGTGYDILKNIAFPWPVASIVHQHHERIDGSGYPRGLKGDQIIDEAKVVAVADVVEAMASHRPYRPALGIDAAMAEIEAGRGKRYDTEIANACLRLVREKGLNPLE